MSPKIIEGLNLQMTKSSKSINVHFAKGKLHQTSWVAIGEEVKRGDIIFVEDFTICKMDGINLILENTFFEIYKIKIKRQPL